VVERAIGKGRSVPALNPTVERVVRRRLTLWPDPQSRSAAARMYADGASLAEVLLEYPDGPIARRPEDGEPARPDRRAIYAHWALLQEIQGEPDTDPNDSVAVKRLIAEKGYEQAAVQTGSALAKYGGKRPNLRWYREQAPPEWQDEYERAMNKGPEA
jgi:hypothetical protein